MRHKMTLALIVYSILTFFIRHCPSRNACRCDANIFSIYFASVSPHPTLPSLLSSATHVPQHRRRSAAICHHLIERRAVLPLFVTRRVERELQEARLSFYLLRCTTNTAVAEYCIYFAARNSAFRPWSFVHSPRVRVGGTYCGRL